MNGLKPFVLMLSTLLVAGCNRKTASSEATPSEPVRSAFLQEQAPEPAPAPSETPAGPATRATIGYQGGSLKSADGRMEISLPPSALYADTQVSIQPVNSDDLDGIGPEYLLSPEGTQFNQPVMLTWHLSDAELSGRAITDSTIATRDENGVWKSQSGVKYDADAKIVRVATSHFSKWRVTWADYLPDLRITPTQDDVRINKSLELRVTKVQTNPDKAAQPSPQTNSSSKNSAPPAQQVDGGMPGKTSMDNDSDLLTPPGKASEDSDLLTVPGPCQWKVNGVAHGNPTYGYIRPDETQQKATYTAPDKIPQRNPVAVRCEIKTGHAKVIAISNITITDKQGWQVQATYIYANNHSVTGPTGFGTTATNSGDEYRGAFALFHVYSDSRYAAGAVGGMGKGEIREILRGSIRNSMCYVNDKTNIDGPISAEASGSASKAGQLSVLLHGDNLKGHLQHTGTCTKRGSDSDWDTASFGVSCNFTGVDYDKGGTFNADIPSDRGKGKCTLQITPDYVGP